MEKIILDTDIGDDIDDALALQLVLNSPELELLGVTTVCKRSDWRARIARSQLAVNGKEDIPVVCGASQPLSGSWDDHRDPNQYDPQTMGGLEADMETGASRFLREQAARYPGEVTVVAIGMLTNVAQALQDDPRFARNVKRIVLMGGDAGRHYSEWNIRWDPEAAAIVFDSGVPLTMVGLDVTMQCSLTHHEALRLLAEHPAPYARLLSQLITRWAGVAESRPIYLHDPLAVLAAADPSVVTTAAKLVRVETEGRYTRGMTFTFDSPFGEPLPEKPNADVCVAVDKERVIRLFKQRVLGQRLAKAADRSG